MVPKERTPPCRGEPSPPCLPRASGARPNVAFKHLIISHLRATSYSIRRAYFYHRRGATKRSTTGGITRSITGVVEVYFVRPPRSQKMTRAYKHGSSASDSQYHYTTKGVSPSLLYVQVLWSGCRAPAAAAISGDSEHVHKAGRHLNQLPNSP